MRVNSVFQFVVGVYGLSVGIFVLYFNWQYAHENGFWAWLFFGEVIATFKGILWPLFISG